MPRLRLMLVDDHSLFRRGLAALLGDEPDLDVAGQAADASAALRVASELQPDLILLDNHLPGVRGIEAIPGLREVAPNAKIIVLTVSEDGDDLAAALRAGANGYLLKTVEREALIDGLHRAMTGESVLSPEMTAKLVAAFRSATAPGGATATTAGVTATTVGAGATLAGAPALAPSSGQAAAPADTAEPDDSPGLSPRELETLREIARGASNKEIARTLGIAETTVKIHVQRILRKLNLTSRVQAAVYASGRGLR